jgi:hypothetical protein
MFKDFYFAHVQF